MHIVEIEGDKNKKYFKFSDSKTFFKWQYIVLLLSKGKIFLSFLSSINIIEKVLQVYKSLKEKKIAGFNFEHLHSFQFSNMNVFVAF